MLEILLWALFIGGLPTIGYYLYQYGRQLHERRQRQRAGQLDLAESRAQWLAGLRFRLGCCLYAGFGLVLIQWLKSLDQQ